MLVSETPIKVDVPHEQYEDDHLKKGEWIEFRRLSARALALAREARAKKAQSEAANMLRELGPKFFRAMQEGDDESKRRIVREMEELEYHISNFDVDTLLKEGIIAWSYDEKLPSDYDNPSEGLDERTARWAAIEIVNITRPPTEEEEGNS